MNKLLILGTIFSINVYADVPVFDATAYANLIQQLSSVQQQVSYMQQNLTQLGSYNWVNINSSASQIAQAMNAANAMSYASNNVANQFQQSYPGYKADQNYQQSYSTISSNSLNTFKGTLQALNMSYSTFQNDSARLTAMQGQAQGATGAMQALSVNAQLAGETVNQLSQLRTVMMAQASSENAYMAQQAQVEATKKANSDALFLNGATTAPAYGTYKIDPTIYP